MEGSSNLLVIPEGLVIDTEKRQYITSKVNAQFAVKRSFSNEKKDIKKGLITIFGGESYLVAGTCEISNLELLRDIEHVIHFAKYPPDLNMQIDNSANS